MIISTTGIVLNKFRYKDTSLIVRVITRDTGLCSFIVRVGKGKRKKNIFNYFQPLSIIEIEYDSNNKRDLHFFKEVDLKFNFKSIHKQFLRILHIVKFHNYLVFHKAHLIHEFFRISLLQKIPG